MLGIAAWDESLFGPGLWIPPILLTYVARGIVGRYFEKRRERRAKKPDTKEGHMRLEQKLGGIRVEVVGEKEEH